MTDETGIDDEQNGPGTAPPQQRRSEPTAGDQVPDRKGKWKRFGFALADFALAVLEARVANAATART